MSEYDGEVCDVCGDAYCSCHEDDYPEEED